MCVCNQGYTADGATCAGTHMIHLDYRLLIHVPSSYLHTFLGTVRLACLVYIVYGNTSQKRVKTLTQYMFAIDASGTGHKQRNTCHKGK